MIFLQSQDGKEEYKREGAVCQSARPVKPKKKSAPTEMFGVDDLSDHANNPGGISSSDDIVPCNTDQPDRPRAKGRGSQCHTPPSGSVFSDWKIRSHSSPDRFTGQRSLGESTSGEFMDKSTGQLCSTGQGGLEQQSLDRLTGPLSTGRDRTGQKSPTKSTDRTGCQSPDESTGHGTVELSTSQRTLDKSTGQLKLSSVQHGRIPMGQRSSTEQSTTIRYMGHSSDRGPTVTSRNRYSTGPDQTNSSDYRKIGYRTDIVPDRTGHRRSVVSRDRSK